MKAYCGGCKYFQVDSQKLDRGNCHYEPPKLFPIAQPQSVTFIGRRPPLGRDDVACAQYIPTD